MYFATILLRLLLGHTAAGIVSQSAGTRFASPHPRAPPSYRCRWCLFCCRFLPEDERRALREKTPSDRPCCSSNESWFVVCGGGSSPPCCCCCCFVESLAMRAVERAGFSPPFPTASERIPREAPGSRRNQCRRSSEALGVVHCCCCCCCCLCYSRLSRQTTSFASSGLHPHRPCCFLRRRRKRRGGLVFVRPWCCRTPVKQRPSWSFWASSLQRRHCRRCCFACGGCPERANPRRRESGPPPEGFVPQGTLSSHYRNRCWPCCGRCCCCCSSRWIAWCNPRRRAGSGPRSASTARGRRRIHNIPDRACLGPCQRNEPTEAPDPRIFRRGSGVAHPGAHDPGILDRNGHDRCHRCRRKRSRRPRRLRREGVPVQRDRWSTIFLRSSICCGRC
mmetsp:Transcript_23578/g.48046  ORF Transcript_23578/g.48046 Transcript_23578/m.48046 type:complete len:392 (-) Transcript_23578:32-1207(-)